MEFLDPRKERRSRQFLLIEYCLIALAIGMATLILLYISSGIRFDTQGRVTQNGLVFVSSQPSGASIYLNGEKYKANSNTRLGIPANTYTMRISLSGYRDWERQIVVNGNDVQHFDYPFLFPVDLKTTAVAEFAADPSMATQSPDKRWILTGQADANGTFALYDLGNPAKPVATSLVLPEGTYNPGDGAQTWKALEWAADNKHVLLAHTYTLAGAATTEYVLLDRDTITASENVSTKLGLAVGQIPSLFNNRIEQYYVFDTAKQTLSRINQSDSSVVSTLSKVIAYKTYADNKILYITDQAPTGKLASGQVTAVLQDGQNIISLRTLPAGASSYPLDIAQYDGDWFAIIGASNDKTVYIYKNPQSQVATSADNYLPAWRRLQINNPSYVSFSDNTQYIMAENGQDFAVYDFENLNQYRYSMNEPLDSGQTHATWMDGNRIQYVTGGKLMVFDYDKQNKQTLVTAAPQYHVFYSSDFRRVYSVTSAVGSTGASLNTTSLIVTK